MQRGDCNMLNFEGLGMQKLNIPSNTKAVIDFLQPTTENKKKGRSLHSSDYNSVSKYDNQTNDPILFLHFKTNKV